MDAPAISRKRVGCRTSSARRSSAPLAPATIHQRGRRGSSTRKEAGSREDAGGKEVRRAEEDRPRPEARAAVAAYERVETHLPELLHQCGSGLELIERFRATIRRHGQERKPVPLLAIYTALRNELAEQLEHCPSVPSMLARRANVDWVFEKGHPEGSDDPFGLQLRNVLKAFDLTLPASKQVRRLRGSRLPNCFSPFVPHPNCTKKQ